MACGSYGGSIYLLGGQPANAWPEDPNNDHQLVTYSISDNNFTDKQTFLGISVSNDGQFYTQTQDQIITLGPRGSALWAYNMTSNTFTVLQENIPVDVEASSACLASTAEYIFVLGGIHHPAGGSSTVLSNAQVLHLTSSDWFNASNMNVARTLLSCIAVEDGTFSALYAIGGDEDGFSRSTSEKMPISDRDTMAQSNWTSIDYPASQLSLVPRSIRAVYHDGRIIILGAGGLTQGDQVFALDTHDDSVVTLPDLMPYPLANGLCAVIVEDTLYTFGGNAFYNGTVAEPVNVWAKLELQLADSSESPSTPPTLAAPSGSPTESPSSSLTSAEPSGVPGYNTTPFTGNTAQTINPTGGPTTFVSDTPALLECADIDVEIYDLDGVTPDILLWDESLQTAIANITKSSIDRVIRESGSSFSAQYSVDFVGMSLSTESYSAHCNFIIQTYPSRSPSFSEFVPLTQWT